MTDIGRERPGTIEVVPGPPAEEPAPAPAPTETPAPTEQPVPA